MKVFSLIIPLIFIFSFVFAAVKIELARPSAAWLGVPSEILPLMVVKPLSGSSSIAVLSDILETYGVDSFIGRSACVAYGSSETVFYITAVYFSGVKRKSIPAAVVISLLSFFAAVVFGCLLCRLF